MCAGRTRRRPLTKPRPHETQRDATHQRGRPTAQCPVFTSTLGTGESIDPDFLSKVGRQQIERPVDGDPGAVSNSNHSLKIRNDGRRVDDPLLSQRLLDNIAGLRDLRRSSNHRIRVGDQLCSIRHPGHIIAGLIRVEENAQRTDAYQTNRNLVIGSSAEANSLPGLEILANEVKCSHGATTSKIDEDQLFYLQSRGIPNETAQQLLLLAFFEEIIAQAPDELTETLRQLLREKLEGCQNTGIAS